MPNRQFRYGEHQPKHTWYDRRWFRSKLEAEWAIFFDALGLTWAYEPKKFLLGDLSYTPDFRITDWKCYVEIKPLTKIPHDTVKLRRLSKAQKKFGVLLITGKPWLGDYEVRYFRYNDIHDNGTALVFGQRLINSKIHLPAFNHFAGFDFVSPTASKKLRSYEE